MVWAGCPICGGHPGLADDHADDGADRFFVHRTGGKEPEGTRTDGGGELADQALCHGLSSPGFFRSSV